jgi:AcrR family transcriptional regulator
MDVVCVSITGETNMATQVRVNQNDPRVKRTRKLLKQALADLLREKPFQDVTVQDIADRATVNRVTFYAHFEDKYDLASSVIRDGFVESLEAVLPPSSALSADNLQLLCRVVLESLSGAHTQCRPLNARYGPLFESAVQEALAAFILDWLRHRSRDDLLPGLTLGSLAASMSWTIFGGGIDWSRDSGGRTLDSFADEIVTVLMCGVSEVFRQDDQREQAVLHAVAEFS